MRQKFCVNCTHHGVGNNCTRPTTFNVNLVTGLTMERLNHPCADERADESGCGPKGNFFSAKETV